MKQQKEINYEKVGVGFQEVLAVMFFLAEGKKLKKNSIWTIRNISSAVFCFGLLPLFNINEVFG